MKSGICIGKILENSRQEKEEEIAEYLHSYNQTNEMSQEHSQV